MDGVPCEDFSFPLIQAEDFTVADPPIAVGAKGAEGLPDHVVPVLFEEEPQESWHLVGSNGYRVVAPPEAPALLSGPLFWNRDFCSTDWDCTVEHPSCQDLQASLEVDPSTTHVEGVPRNTIKQNRDRKRKRGRKSPRPFRSPRQVRGPGGPVKDQVDSSRCSAKSSTSQESALQFRAHGPSTSRSPVQVLITAPVEDLTPPFPGVAGGPGQEFSAWSNLVI